MNRMLVPAFGVLCLISAPMSRAADVKTDYDHSANFSQYHTYSWGDVKTDDPLYVSRIKDAVNKDLQAKGWQMVPSGGSTMVFANGSIKDEKEVETYYNNFGGGWGNGFGFRRFGCGFGGGGFGEATSSTVNQPIGHLVVDIFDSSSHDLLFRGISDNNLSNKADKNTKNLDKNIDKMFKSFPPPSKG